MDKHCALAYVEIAGGVCPGQEVEGLHSDPEGEPRDMSGRNVGDLCVHFAHEVIREA